MNETMRCASPLSSPAAGPAPESGAESVMVSIMDRLVRSLDEAGVRYCHFKSNLHLKAALTGGTDFDVLVRFEDRERFLEILRDLDIRKVVSPPDKSYPDVEDHIGFDRDTGRLIHVHAHFRLVVGEMYVKNHVLPQGWLLDGLVRRMGAPVPTPERELLLLCIRAVLKTNYSLLDQVRGRTVRPDALFPDAIHEEFRFLLDQCDQAGLAQACAASGLPFDPEEILALAEQAADKTLTIAQARRLKRDYLDRLVPWRRERSIVWRQRWCGLLRKGYFPGLAGPRRKVFTGRGAFVAFVGADGAGKSTLVKDLCSWLAWKIEHRSHYFGIPDDHRRRLVRAQRLQQRKTARGLGDRLLARAWLKLANHRRELFERAAGFAAAGGVAVADRFPMRAFRSMPQPMDGPRIRKELPNVPVLMAEYEEFAYDRIGLPDLVVTLCADFDVLRSRKTDIGAENQRIKAEAVNNLAGPGLARIDASQAYEQVLLEAKRLIWDTLHENR